MTARPVALGAALGLWWTAATARAEPNLELVVDSRAVAFVERLRAELLASGYTVGDGTTSTDATVTIVDVQGTTRIELRVAADPTRAFAVEVLASEEAAVSVAERLRALLTRPEPETLPPPREPLPEEDDDAAVEAPDAPPPVVRTAPPPVEDPEVEPEPPPDPPRLWLGALVVGRFPTEGLGLDAELRVRARLGDRAAVGLVGSVPMSPTRAANSAGSAELRPYLVGAEGLLTPVVDVPFRGGLAVQLLRLDVVARPATGFLAQDDGAYAFVGSGRLEVAPEISERFRVIAGVGLGVVAPNLEIAFVGRPVGRWGPYVASASVGLEAAPF